MGNGVVAKNNTFSMASDAWENFDMGELEEKRHD